MLQNEKEENKIEINCLETKRLSKKCKMVVELVETCIDFQ